MANAHKHSGRGQTLSVTFGWPTSSHSSTATPQGEQKLLNCSLSGSRFNQYKRIPCEFHIEGIDRIFYNKVTDSNRLNET